MANIGGIGNVNEAGQPIELRWSSNIEFDDACLRRIAKETTLKKLSIYSSQGTSNAGVGALQSLSKLEDLYISLANVGCSSLRCAS